MPSTSHLPYPCSLPVESRHRPRQRGNPLLDCPWRSPWWRPTCSCFHPTYPRWAGGGGVLKQLNIPSQLNLSSCGQPCPKLNLHPSSCYFNISPRFEPSRSKLALGNLLGGGLLALAFVLLTLAGQEEGESSKNVNLTFQAVTSLAQSLASTLAPALSTLAQDLNQPGAS